MLIYSSIHFSAIQGEQVRTMTEVEKELQEASGAYDALYTKVEASAFADGGGALVPNILLTMAVLVVSSIIFDVRQDYYDYSNDYLAKAAMLSFSFFVIFYLIVTRPRYMLQAKFEAANERRNTARIEYVKCLVESFYMTAERVEIGYDDPDEVYFEIAGEECLFDFETMRFEKTGCFMSADLLEVLNR